MDKTFIGKKKYSSSLTAAALQDHISRQISLSDPTVVKVKRKKQALKLQLKPSKSCTKCGSQGSAEQEYVLDVAPPPLTLAQSLGLVEAPQQLLSCAEWEGVRVCSNKREDSRLPCPICQEEFRLSQQALLSCSHVFHLTCLKSFERFSRTKRCPLCRREGYQTRVVYEGAKQTRIQAATRIQSGWRGYKVRCCYKAYRETHPPSHPSLRKRHYEDKLSRLTGQLMMSCDVRAEGVASMLSECDQSLEKARSVMRAFDICTDQDDDLWTSAREKAKSHLLSDCSVCLTHLTQPHTLTKPRPLTLLSCGHLLHTSCINSLEQYSDSCAHLCPLCRSPYSKIAFT
ncbi:RING finger protein 32-like [Halichondria panicea]|uniref:RING finger protein 32-like n=1 Tax=Halichondria panicea TaxID=6063 RepID=UPI00312B4CE8